MPSRSGAAEADCTAREHIKHRLSTTPTRQIAEDLATRGAERASDDGARKKKWFTG